MMPHRLALMLAALALLAAPVPAQEPTPAPPPEEPAAEPSPLVAAGWCVVSSGSDDPTTVEAPEGEEPTAVEPVPDPGCDIGIGLALRRFGKASAVAVVGTETVGLGLAWVAHRPARGPVIAVAVGAVMRYDGEGIDGGEIYPAVGATLSFIRRGGSE